MSTPGDRSVIGLTQLNTIQGNEIIYAYSPGLAIDGRFTPALLVPYIQQFIPQGPIGPGGPPGHPGSPEAGIEILIASADGGTLSPGIKVIAFDVPFDCTIVSARMYGDQTGSAVVDFSKSTFDTYPTFASITGASPLTISSGVKVRDTTLSGWSKNFSQGDILRVTINSVSTFTSLTIALEVNKT